MTGINGGAAGVGPTTDKVQALRVDEDGTVHRVAVALDESGSCDQMLREQIGCGCFDVVSLTGDLDMWVNPTGMYNTAASAIAASYGFGYRPYFGVALFTSRRGEHTVGLDSDQLATLEDMAAAFCGGQGMTK